jgi:hypothetical protein
MVLELEPYIFSEAVKFYWDQRSAQKRKQSQAGTFDQGTRSDVTGGQQMNGFAEKIVELLTSVGVAESDIYVKQKRDLPGYFRPHKGWDILIVSGKQLHATIELKSQVGPSFGNNFNNRTEEAIGSSEDFWTAYREKAFADSPQPWLGYFFLLEDCPESHVKRGVNEPHFPVMSVFKDTSYAQRYEIFCRRLVLERKYSSACLILTDSKKAQLKENYIEPASDLSVNQFLTQLLSHMTMVADLNRLKQTQLI